MNDQCRVILLATQTFLSTEIVVEKVQQQSLLSALVSPEFIIEDQYYRVILDGHHSIRAHQITGKEIKFQEASRAGSDYITPYINGEFRAFFTTNRSEFQEGI